MAWCWSGRTATSGSAPPRPTRPGSLRWTCTSLLISCQLAGDQLAGPALTRPLGRVEVQQVAEGPGRLLDAGAGVAVDGARATAVIPLDGPDRHQRQPVGAGEGQHLAGVAEV